MLLLVGDVQGCHAALLRLLAEAGFSPSRHRLVVLGDLVNRGPDSPATLRLLRGFGDAATCLLGNHDLHLLAVAHGVRRLHRGDSFGDVLEAPDRAPLLDWLAQQKLAHLEAGWLCVHAGVVPQWGVQSTLELADEVHGVLRGPELPGFLAQMYGNEPSVWSDGLQGIDRWRFVINVLTRIRFCTDDGRLEFETKDGTGAAPPGYRAWFDIPHRATQGQPVAFGHWSTLGLIDRPDLLALDTGCVWGGALSAMRVDGGRRELIQVRCEQTRRPGS